MPRFPRRRRQAGPAPSSDARSADVIGSVTVHFGLCDAKITAADGLRHRVGRVIAGDQPSARPVGTDNLVWLVGQFCETFDFYSGGG